MGLDLAHSAISSLSGKPPGKQGPEPLPGKAHGPDQTRHIISHNVYYVQGDPRVAGTHLASTLSPAVAWSLIVRNRNLTGPWAGFSFKAGRLVTPEGRELEPQDLAWLSLLAAQAQEWRRMMEIARGAQKRPFGRAGIVDLAEVAHRRAQRSSGAMAGPDADPVGGALPVPGPIPRQRV
ncbi:phage protein [Stenotrophomonas maltophilia]|nr:DUF3653 domain-containing protein [Stenotrophomonas maltophilia]UXB30295.1 phage protein [Stenotrophomonas maltophilia]